MIHMDMHRYRENET